MIIERLKNFLDSTNLDVSPIRNERALQLEIGMMFRHFGWRVEFEKRYEPASMHPFHTRRRQNFLDLVVSDGNKNLAIELKLPLAGRVPETMYDFYCDVASTESVVRSGAVDSGACLMLTNDAAYWSGRELTGIYRPLRVYSASLSGIFKKPTGAKDSQIVIEKTYLPIWQNLGNQSLLSNGRYVLLEID